MNRLLLVVASLVALLFWSNYQSPARQVQAARNVVGSAPVVLLSASWCRYCKMMRDKFQHWGVHYVEYDVERDSRGREAYARLGKDGVPITLIGSQRVNGYSPSRVHSLILGLHGQASSLSANGG